MTLNPKSLSNLKSGANKKNAVKVTLTLKPETVKLLKMTGNMSEAVDKFIELVRLGYVQHDGCLNPPSGSEVKNLQSHHTDSVNEKIELPCPEPKPKAPYWMQVLTRQEMIERAGFSAYKLDKMPVGTAIRDSSGELWWKEAIGRGNESLRPLGSRANTVWCR